MNDGYLDISEGGGMADQSPKPLQKKFNLASLPLIIKGILGINSPDCDI